MILRLTERCDVGFTFLVPVSISTRWSMADHRAFLLSKRLKSGELYTDFQGCFFIMTEMKTFEFVRFMIFIVGVHSSLCNGLSK